MVVKETLSFVCGYCGHKFSEEVGTSGTGNKVSTQVRCQKCHNFVKNDTGR